MRDSFIFFKSFYDAINCLGEKAQLKLYKSIMQLNFNCCENVTELEQLCNEIETELKQNRHVFAQFLLIKPHILKSMKASFNGSLGGAPKQNKNAQKNKLKEIEKEEEYEKEEEIKKEKKEKDLFVSTEIEKTFSLYQKNCPNLCKLSFERRNMDLRRKIEDFLFEIRGDMSYFEVLCKKANEIKHIANRRIDFKSLLNNHIGIMNGKYEKPPDEAEEAVKRFMEKY